MVIWNYNGKLFILHLFFNMDKNLQTSNFGSVFINPFSQQVYMKADEAGI